MAEGFIRARYGDRYDVVSAGTNPSEVNPHAIEVMKEIQIDISGHSAKHIDEFVDKKFDYVVTVCDSAGDACPFFPGGKNHIHRAFRDPSRATGSEDDIMKVFRQVRDEIETWIGQTFG